MKRTEWLKRIDADWIDRLYRWCYARTAYSHEAEELCSDILCAVVKSCRADEEVGNPAAYFRAVARHVYADYCEKRHICTENTAEMTDALLETLPDEEDYESGEEDERLLSSIYRTISNLSSAYRRVMIGYYLDGRSVAQLAKELSLAEATVRQRLFSARNEVRNGVTKMNNAKIEKKPVALEEMSWAEIGTGNPGDGDPRDVCARQLSKHVIWLCRKQPQTARRISDELGVPMSYIEEELDIQVKGANGRYGMLRRTDSGRYIVNCILLDEKEIAALMRLYTDCIPAISEIVMKHIEDNREKYLSFPYINKKPTLNLILWQQVFRMADAFSDCVESKLQNTYMSDIRPSERPFTVFCYRNGTGPEAKGWGAGWDGVDASEICGWHHVHLNNIYIGRIRAHFHCGHVLSNDARLRMALRAIHGLPVADLTSDEREIAAKAVECGYLYREDDTLYTKFLVNREEDSPRLFDTTELLYSRMPEDKVDAVAAGIAGFVRESIPGHLHGDYRYVNRLANLPVLDTLVEALIDKGVLTPPENGVGAEGIWMSVK